ncbi:dihydrofolate reductase [Phyllobacterium ifriqiyense]
MPSATSVVARSHPDHIIGIENELPWRLKTDLRRFKQLTEGNAIIMGRKTYESIGRPLPNRINIVLSRTPVEDTASVKWAHNPETALLLADYYSILLERKEFFLIGGEEIYKLFHKFINVVYLTEVFCGNINGDAKFDFEFDRREWRYYSEEDFPKSDDDEFAFRTTCLVRRKSLHRFRTKEEFMGRDDTLEKIWERYAAMMEKLDDENPVKQEQLDIFGNDVTPAH